MYLTKSGYSVEVICSTKAVNAIEYLKEYCQVITYNFEKLFSYLQLWLYLIKQKNDLTIVINTAQGNRTLKFMLLPLLKKMKLFGIIHDLNKIESSKGQKLITRKIFKYLAIAEYLDNSSIAKKHKIKAINTSMFPRFNTNDIIKNDNEIWIAIPGNIEVKRRDYHWLIEVCTKHKLDQNIKFILLGNSNKGEGNEIVNSIIEWKLENHFIWFNSFVNQDLFNSYIQKSDYLLPLLHEKSSEYLNHKISGIFSISESFSKPMILHSNYKPLGFYYCCTFYSSTEDFINLISVKPNIDCKPFEFEKNRLKYLEVIQLT